MHTAMKVAIASAAVVVVAIAGLTLIPGNGPVGIAAPTPTPTPAPTPASFDGRAPGALEPGTYVLEAVQPFSITFSVPAGWEELGRTGNDLGRA